MNFKSLFRAVTCLLTPFFALSSAESGNMEMESLALPSLRSESNSSSASQLPAIEVNNLPSIETITLSVENPGEMVATAESNETVVTIESSAVAVTSAASTNAPPPSAVERSAPTTVHNPAAISVTHRAAWRPDLFFDLSFLYWHASEQGLDLATSASLVLNNQQTAYVASLTSNGRSLIQQFDYKPGFQIGFGADFFGWSLLGRYTWIRQTTSVNSNAPNPVPSGGTPIWSMNDWFLQLSPILQALSATYVSSRWHLALDIADLEFGRPYYQGDHLLVSPFLGLRAAWIRQSLRITVVPPSEISSLANALPVSHNQLHSWGIGPRVGLTASCLLPKGWYLDGDLAGSLLFTQYTTVSHRENNGMPQSTPALIATKLSNYCCLRPEFEMGLGFGWGQYFFSRNYHIDFSASYQFVIFWEQNMMRSLMDQTIDGIGASPGDLYLHGLTIRGRFDF